MIRFLIPQFIGICALVYFYDMGAIGPFFDAAGQVSSDSDVTMKAMPIFLGKLLPVGLLGIVAAGMIAAFMSTHDTYLLCWSSVLTEDVVNPLASKRMSQRARIVLTRTFLVMIAVFLVIWVSGMIWVRTSGTTWQCPDQFILLVPSLYFCLDFIGSWRVLPEHSRPSSLAR